MKQNVVCSLSILHDLDPRLSFFSCSSVHVCTFCHYLFTVLNLSIFFVLLFQYYSQTGLPSKSLDRNVCAVCGNDIFIMNNEDAVIEKTIKLNCGHVYPFMSNLLLLYIIIYIVIYIVVYCRIMLAGQSLTCFTVMWAN
jgi:hypothetical protein